MWSTPAAEPDDGLPDPAEDGGAGEGAGRAAAAAPTDTLHVPAEGAAVEAAPQSVQGGGGYAQDLTHDPWAAHVNRYGGISPNPVGASSR